MLVHLTVRNFALVAELHVEFNDGLTVLTGESGTGKSILLNALALVLGVRASRSQTRPGAEFCEVIAEFNVNGQIDATSYLVENELQDKDDANACVVRRVARVDGRSRAWINSTPVNVSELRRLCTNLVEVHGQFEQQKLMNASTQLAWLDAFISHPTLRTEVSQRYRTWQRLKFEFEELQTQQQSAHEKQELLEYQVKELNEASIGEAEFETLNARYSRLTRAQEIRQSLYEVQQRLDNNTTDDLGQIKGALNRIRDDAEPLRQAIEQLDTAAINVEEASGYLRQYVDYFEFDHAELEDMSNRLDLIHDLARKHRCDPSELVNKYHELERELEKIERNALDVAQLESDVGESERSFIASGEALSTLRQQVKQPFTQAVIELLHTMGMKDAQFDIAFLPTVGETGLERVEYLVTANSKYPLDVLQKVASGGELSRISLAIFIVVAKQMKLPSLVLDEADIGVGGTTADTVGRLLRKLAENSQVICVTHAPQVAALGESHIKVLKNEEQEIQVQPLNESNRIEEIARMVGGQKVNTSSREHARSLLAEAQSTTTGKD